MKTVLAFLSRHLAFSLMAAIVVVVFALLAFDSAGMPKPEKNDFTPHVLCTSGRTVVKRPEGSVTLLAEKTEDVRQGDQIKTLRQSSATVFWADGSVTRLSENTTIDVNELVNDKKTASTKIDFSLTEGKTWSHVYRYLTEDSHFRERFDEGNKVAAVRGTAFEVNADQGYLRTASHAVDVTDPAGKLLSTVPEGVAVNAKSLQSLINAALDTAWEKANVAEDLKYSREMAERAKGEVSARLSALKDLPVTVSFSGNSLSVDVSKDFVAKARSGQYGYGELLRAYEATAALPEDASTIRSKEILRDAILAAAPADRKEDLASLFARHQTYDSWAAAATGGEEFLRIRKKVREYVEAGAKDSELKNLESALPKEKVEQFNSAMEELKKLGVEGLSDPSLFLSESKEIFDSATNGVKSTLDGVQKLLPNLAQ